MTNATCPQCERPLEIDSLRVGTLQCSGCRSMLSWDGQQLTLAAVRCPSCGESISADAISCPACQVALSLED